MRRTTVIDANGGAAKRIPEVPSEPLHHSKKDTKRWCKGVVGREHQKEWVEWMRIGTTSGAYEWLYERQKCTICGKQLKSRETKIALRAPYHA